MKLLGLCVLALLNCYTRCQNQSCSTLKSWNITSEASRNNDIDSAALQTSSISSSSSVLSLSSSYSSLLSIIRFNEPKYLGIISVIGRMVWKTFEDYTAGCHFVFVTTTAVDNPLLNQITRTAFKEKRPMTFIVVKNKYQNQQTMEFKEALHGGPTTICRVYLIDLAVGDNEDLLQFLDANEIWLWPEARVVIIGEQKQARVILHHSALRNVLNPIYIGLKTNLLSRVGTSNVNSLRKQANGNMKTEDDAVSSSSLRIYGRAIFGDKGTPKIQFLFRWWLGSTIPHIQFSTYDQTTNLRGHFLRFVSIPTFPYIDYTPDTDEPGATVTLRDCLDKRMIETFAFHLNFTYEVRVPIDRQWGLPTRSGNWTGMLGAIQRNKADLTTTIAPNSGRITIINPTRCYTSDVLAIVSLKPQLIPQYLVITQPFKGEVWLSLFLCTMIWGLTLWSLQKARAYFLGKTSNSLSWALLYSWAVVLEDPPPRPPTDISSQTLIGWWLLASLVMATGYKSSLVAFLTVQSRTTPVDTFHELVNKKDWDWGINRLTFTGAILTYFGASTDPLVKLVYQNLETTTVDEGLKKVQLGKYAFLNMRNDISAIIKSYHTDNFGISPYYISKGGHPIFSDYGWGIRKGAPYRDRINQMMNRMIEAGIVTHWTEDVMALRVKENRKSVSVSANETHKTTVFSDNKLIALRMSHLLGVFLLLILGFCTSSMALLGEVLVSSW